MGGWAGRGGVPDDGMNGSDPKKTVVNTFNEVSSVPQSSETVIHQYIVPPNSRLLLSRVEFSGSNIATFRLYINGAQQAQLHTWFNGTLADAWDFSSMLGGLLVPAGQIVKVTAVHERPTMGTFNARISGIVIVE